MKKTSFLLFLIVVIALMLAPFSVQASGNITVTTDVFNGICKVTASFENGADTPASIEIIPSDANIDDLAVLSDALNIVKYYNQDYCNQQGFVSFEIPLKESGEYKARSYSMTGSGEVLECTFSYLSFEDAKYIWDNLTSNPVEYLPELLEFLDIKDEQILSMSQDAQLLSMIETYGSIGEFSKENAPLLISRIKSDCEDLFFVKQVLNEIKNTENTTEINAIVKIDDKAAILGITEYMSRYNALENTKIADGYVVGKSYATTSEFVSDFVAGIEAAEKSQKENPLSQNPPKTPSVNSVGGGSLGSSVVVPAPTQQTHTFIDVSTVPWATDAIVALYNEGIINGKSENEFAPNDNITREEFVKIALGVMGLKPVNGAVSFADVDSSSWYAPYVNAAVSAGIISGYSDTRFGVGEFITRQDVAVILSRVYSITNVNSVVTFSDVNDISDYAKPAVEKLSAAGVINGSDGNFKPKSSCTRAEAACMVYRMMSLMKEGK